MKRLSSKNRGLLLACVAFIAGIGWAVWTAGHAPLLAPLQSGSLFPKARPLKDFELRTDAGQSLGRADLIGHWTVIYVGYTSCPDECPTTLAVLKAVAAQLGPAMEHLKVWFVSIDPERDTPVKLGSYVHYFDPRFIAATASIDALTRFGGDVGFVFLKEPGGTAQAYTMDHSSAMILIDPQARIAGYLTPPFEIPKLVSDLNFILSSGKN